MRTVVSSDVVSRDVICLVEQAFFATTNDTGVPIVITINKAK